VSSFLLKDFFPEQLNSLLSNKNNGLSESFELKPKEYAFEKIKKLPLTTYKNVRSAMAHFYNVKNVTEEDRKVAFKKIFNKAEYFKICTIEFLSKYEQYVDNAQNS